MKVLTFDDQIAFSTSESYTVACVGNLVCCLAEKGYTRLYFNGHEALLISKGLGQLESFLPKEHFVRVHNNAIVNLGHIRKVLKGAEGSLLLSNGMNVSLADRRKKDLMGRLQVF